MLRSPFFDRESIEVGHDRIHVLVGKFDLWHFLMPRNHALREFRLQLARIKPGIDIAHRWGFLEGAFASGFDSVAAPAFFLKDDLASCRYLAEVGGVQVSRQIHQQSDAEAQSLSCETR